MVAISGGKVKDEACVFINVGRPATQYKPHIAIVTMPEGPYTTLSYRVVKGEANSYPKVSDATDGEENFMQHVHRRINKAWLTIKQKSRWTAKWEGVNVCGKRSTCKWASFVFRTIK